MKRMFAILACLSMLAGCSGASVTYEVMFPESLTAERESSLLSSALRVIERRMANIGEALNDLNLNRRDGSTFITVAAENAEALKLLTDEITEPFDLKIMEEAPEDEADIVVEGHGGFRQTGLTQEHLEWLAASEEPEGKGRVTLIFTQKGRDLMAEVFQKNVGGYIGLFVRDRLVSKLLVETDVVRDDIIITDIPSVELANIFADDVNVGLYLTFVPLP